MTSKQLHELPAASALAPEDQLLVSHARLEPDPARQPRQPALPAAAPAGSRPDRSPASLARLVSVKDFGAIGDGQADDSAAFQAALDQHTAVHVPAGTYRLDGEVQVKPRRRLHGAGRDVTVIDARGPRAFTFQRNEGAYRIDRRRRQRLVPQLAVRHADRHDHRRHPRLRARVPRQQPPVLRRRGPGRPRRCRRLVHRPGRRQRVRAPGHPGRLWRRQRACAARQRHPLALEPDRRQLRRQPAGRGVDQAGCAPIPAASSCWATIRA